MSVTRKTTPPAGDLACEIDEFRKVLWTDEQTRRVFMAIPEGGEIGGAVHEGHDRPLCSVAGSGTARSGETAYAVADGDVSNAPLGTFRNFGKTGVGDAEALHHLEPARARTGRRECHQVGSGRVSR